MKKIDFSEYPSTDYLFRIPQSYHHCTLLNYVSPGPKTIEAIKHFLDNAETERRGLFISGTYGVGKTHLLVALYRIILARVGLTDCIYQGFDAFVDMVRKDEGYLSLFWEYEWLFLDDITTYLDKDFNQEILRRVISGRYENRKITCITANGSLKTIAESGLLHQHAVSRLMEMCVEIHIEGHDKRGKRN